jgi:hypothetical protein
VSKEPPVIRPAAETVKKVGPRQKRLLLEEKLSRLGSSEPSLD